MTEQIVQLQKESAALRTVRTEAQYPAFLNNSRPIQVGKCECLRHKLQVIDRENEELREELQTAKWIHAQQNEDF